MAAIHNSSLKTETDEVKPSFDDVVKLANSLTKMSISEDVGEVLLATALAELDPVGTEMIIVAVQGATKLPKKPLRQHLRMIQQELGLLPNDLAMAVAQTVRNSHFNGGTHLIRCPDRSYMRFSGTHWVETTDENLQKLVLEEANKVVALHEGGLASLVSEAKRCLDYILGTDEDVMNALAEPLPVINCLNGELWLDDKGDVTLMPHRPETRMTYCLPIEYDPKAGCPIYDKALLQIFANADDPEDMVRHWHEFVGYASQPRRDIATFWLLVGHGSNGKTRLLQTIQRLVGPDAVLNDQIASFQRDRFNVAALAGKLLFIDDDLAEDVILADGLLKKISEAKEISARHAYGRRKFSFRCIVLPIMAGNGYPRISDVSYGLNRRAMVFPFDRVFGPDEADPSIFSAIWEDEMPGVLNRALEGLKRLRQRGGFDLPADCEEAREEFLCHANPLKAFIESRCDVDPEARTLLVTFRAAMKDWARDQGVRGVSTDNRLKRKLEGLGFEVKMIQGYNKIYGLGLKS